jgi:hypothetical protein
MAILVGSGANADVAEESVMHPIIEAGIMKTRTRPRRTAGRTRLVWRGPPDRAAGRCGRCASCADPMWYEAGADDEALPVARVSRDAAGICDRARRHGPCAQGAGKSSGGRRQ